jgi:hypothetical protein
MCFLLFQDNNWILLLSVFLLAAILMLNLPYRLPKPMKFDFGVGEKRAFLLILE